MDYIFVGKKVVSKMIKIKLEGIFRPNMLIIVVMVVVTDILPIC